MTPQTSALETARDALQELVRLRELARDANELNCSGSWENVRKQRDWREECQVKVPLAYEAARNALARIDTALVAAAAPDERKPDIWIVEGNGPEIFTRSEKTAEAWRSIGYEVEPRYAAEPAVDPDDMLARAVRNAPHTIYLDAAIPAEVLQDGISGAKEQWLTVRVLVRGDNENTPAESLHAALTAAHDKGLVLEWDDAEPTAAPASDVSVQAKPICLEQVLKAVEEAKGIPSSLMTVEPIALTPVQLAYVAGKLRDASIAPAAEPVGVVVADDPVHGWHMKPLVSWESIGANTRLYASALPSKCSHCPKPAACANGRRCFLSSMSCATNASAAPASLPDAVDYALQMFHCIKETTDIDRAARFAIDGEAKLNAWARELRYPPATGAPKRHKTANI